MGVRSILTVIILIAYPLIAHGLILWQIPFAAVAGVVLMAIAYLIWEQTVEKRKDSRKPRVWIYLVLAVWGGINLLTDSVHVLFVPSVVVNTVTAWLIFQSLRPGKIPVMTRVYHLNMDSELPETVSLFARNLTWIWAVYFALMGAVSLALALFAPLAWWSWFANVAYFVVLGVVIAVMHTWQYFYLRRWGAQLRLNIVLRIWRLPLNDQRHPLAGLVRQ